MGRLGPVGLAGWVGWAEAHGEPGGFSFSVSFVLFFLLISFFILFTIHFSFVHYKATPNVVLLVIPLPILVRHLKENSL